ncbi:MAG TPA: ATP-binding protein [Clostridiales bacterium]|nr:ATP-binding protein [Clostridiales bacterium]
MKEIALHVLDIVQNSIEAGATRVAVTVTEDTERDLLTVEIVDNGRGMPPDVARAATDPFVTTRRTRPVGLGLPLLALAARQSGGSLTVDSRPGEGTRVLVTFRSGHVDRPPLGDMALTLACLMAANPTLDLDYVHVRDGREFRVSAADLRSRLDGVGLGNPAVFAFVRDYIGAKIREVSDTGRTTGAGTRTEPAGDRALSN